MYKYIVLIILFFPSVIVGQEPEKKDPAPAPAVEVKQEEEKPIKEVVLVVNNEEINKILVVSIDGRWVHDARHISVDTNIGSSDKPNIKCTIFKGLFKPTQPEVKTWKLANIVMASKEEFQKILDDLQNGKFELQ